LEIWLFRLKMPEELFWKTMNPARLIALYNAHFGAERRAGQEKPAQSETPKGFSLSGYIQGGI